MIFFLLFLFYWLGLSFRYAYIPIFIVAIILAVIVLKKYKAKFFAISFILFGIGIGVSYIRFDHKQTTYSGMIIDAKDNYFIMLSKGERLYVYEKENKYEIGDYLSITGEKKELDFTLLESQFDFKDYLNKKGVYYQLVIKDKEVKFSSPIRIKGIRNGFLEKFDEESRSLIKALMFSSKDSTDDISNMKKLHVMRLASASGIFIYAYLKFLNFIISLIKKKKSKSAIPIIILLPYAIITFPRFTVIRIFSSESFKYINERFLKSKFSSLSVTGFLGFLFLIIDYHLAYDTSFIMGFTLPILMMFIGDALYRSKGLKKKLLIPLFIYLSVIPFELQFYQGINPISILLIKLLSPIFIVLGFSSLISLYGLPIYKVVDFEAKVISKILSFLSKYAFQINTPPMNEYLIVVYVVLFLVLLYYKSIKFIPLERLFTIVYISFLAFYCLPVTNYISTEVYFINIGQGDSCLIRKGNTAVMIDTGGLQNVDLAEQTLIPFLQKEKIYDVDLLITTHDDFDHCGAKDYLIENYYVKDVVTDASLFPITIGGITFNNYNNHIDSYSEDNDKSLVIGFTLSGTSYLITGDAPIKAEREIMKEYESVPCDILKVGHHGSDTSTCDEFVKYLNPKEAVISCGKKNRYGHPKQSVLNTLKRNKVKIRRTDLEGTIRYRHYIFS